MRLLIPQIPMLSDADFAPYRRTAHARLADRTARRLRPKTRIMGQLRRRILEEVAGEQPEASATSTFAMREYALSLALDPDSGLSADERAEVYERYMADPEPTPSMTPEQQLEADVAEIESNAPTVPRTQAAKWQADIENAPPDDVPLDPQDVRRAVDDWTTQTAALVSDLYDAAYADGRANFAEQYPHLAEDGPTVDDQAEPDDGGAKDDAMRTHFASIGKMANELMNIAFVGQLAGWFGKNENRVNLQASQIAWAGEQHGYREAGAGKGLLIDWELDEGADHCDDCPDLADAGPYTDEGGDNPLPTMPGAGDTQCMGNCRCSLNYVQAEPDVPGAEPGDDESLAPEEAEAEVEKTLGTDLSNFGGAISGGVGGAAMWLQDALANLDREVGVTLSKSGKVLGAHVGTKDAVVFQRAQIEAMRGGHLSVHNHPGGQSFSPADVAFAHAMRFGEMDVYSPRWTYMLRPVKGKFDPKMGKAVIDRAEVVAGKNLEAVEAQAQKGFAAQLKGEYKYGIPLSWSDFWKNETADFWHDVWTQVAPEFGLDYRRVETPGWIAKKAEAAPLSKAPFIGMPPLTVPADTIKEEAVPSPKAIGSLPKDFPKSMSDVLDAMQPVPGGPKGSQPGTWYKSPKTGQEFYVKPQESQERAMNEVGTMRAYEAMGAVPGVDIPYVGAVKSDVGKWYVVSQKIDFPLHAETSAWWKLDASGSISETAREQAKQLWAVDALLSHYDVVGMANDNLLVGLPKAGGVQVVRIEGGAGMKFRAQGAVKPTWSPSAQWNEPWTMRAISHGGAPGSGQAGAVFGKMTDKEAAQLIQDLGDYMTPVRLEALRQAWLAEGMTELQAQENLAVIKARLAQVPQVVAELTGMAPVSELPIAKPLALTVEPLVVKGSPASLLAHLPDSPAKEFMYAALDEGKTNGAEVRVIRDAQGQIGAAMSFATPEMLGTDDFYLSNLGSTLPGAGGKLVKELQNIAALEGKGVRVVPAPALKVEGFYEQFGFQPAADKMIPTASAKEYVWSPKVASPAPAEPLKPTQPAIPPIKPTDTNEAWAKSVVEANPKLYADFLSSKMGYKGGAFNYAVDKATPELKGQPYAVRTKVAFAKWFDAASKGDYSDMPPKVAAWFKDESGIVAGAAVVAPKEPLLPFPMLGISLDAWSPAVASWLEDAQHDLGSYSKAKDEAFKKVWAQATASGWSPDAIAEFLGGVTGLPEGQVFDDLKVLVGYSAAAPVEFSTWADVAKAAQAAGVDVDKSQIEDYWKTWLHDADNVSDPMNAFFGKYEAEINAADLPATGFEPVAFNSWDDVVAQAKAEGVTGYWTHATPSGAEELYKHWLVDEQSVSAVTQEFFKKHADALDAIQYKVAPAAKFEGPSDAWAKFQADKPYGTTSVPTFADFVSATTDWKTGKADWMPWELKKWFEDNLAKAEAAAPQPITLGALNDYFKITGTAQQWPTTLKIWKSWADEGGLAGVEAHSADAGAFLKSLGIQNPDQLDAAIKQFVSRYSAAEGVPTPAFIKSAEPPVPGQPKVAALPKYDATDLKVAKASGNYYVKPPDGPVVILGHTSVLSQQAAVAWANKLASWQAKAPQYFQGLKRISFLGKTSYYKPDEKVIVMDKSIANQMHLPQGEYDFWRGVGNKIVHDKYDAWESELAKLVSEPMNSETFASSFAHYLTGDLDPKGYAPEQVKAFWKSKLGVEYGGGFEENLLGAPKVASPADEAVKKWADSKGSTVGFDSAYQKLVAGGLTPDEAVEKMWAAWPNPYGYTSIDDLKSVLGIPKIDEAVVEAAPIVGLTPSESAAAAAQGMKPNAVEQLKADALKWTEESDPQGEKFVTQHSELWADFKKTHMDYKGGGFNWVVQTVTSDLPKGTAPKVRQQVAMARLFKLYHAEPDNLKAAFPKVYKWIGNELSGIAEESESWSVVPVEVTPAVAKAKFEALPAGWDAKASLEKTNAWMQANMPNSRMVYDGWKAAAGGKAQLNSWVRALLGPAYWAEIDATKETGDAYYKIRGLAFTRSYLMAKAGMFDELARVSPALRDYWKDLLFPPPPKPLPPGMAPWAKKLQVMDPGGSKRNALVASIERDLQGHPDKMESWRALRYATDSWKGGSQTTFQQAGERVIKGAATTDSTMKGAAAMWNTIRDAAPTAPELGRSISHSGVKAGIDYWKGLVGKTVDMQLSGFSDSGFDFASSRNTRYILAPGSQAFSTLAFTSGYGGEREWIVGGRFRITKAEKKGGRNYVYLEWVAPDRTGPTTLSEPRL